MSASSNPDRPLRLAGADWLRRAADAGRIRGAGRQGLRRPRRRRRRAQRAARPAGGRRRHRHPGAARGGDRRRQGRRPHRGADRHRPRHGHRRRRPRALRGHDAAPGRRDARPPRHRRLHRRLGGRRAAGATSPSTRSTAAPTASCSTRSAAPPTSRRGACASSATPRERIREDYLRILRFFRLTAEYGEGPPDAAALAACVREREGLARLSAERVRQELLRLLVAPRGPELVRCDAATTACCRSVLASAPRPTLLERLATLEAALAAEPDADCCASPRWRWRCPRTPTAWPTACASPTTSARASPAWPCTPPTSRPGRARGSGPRLPLRRRRRRLPRPRADRLGPLRRRARQPALARAPRPARALAAAALSVGGADVMALGVPAGPRVGELLRALEAWWIAGDFAADETALRAKLKELSG